MKRLNEDRLIKFATHLVCIKETYYFESSISPKDYLSHDEDENLVPLIFQPFLELPFLFPGEWYSDTSSMPLWIEDSEQEIIISIMDFFQLDQMQFCHLFAVGEQYTDMFGGKILDNGTCNSQTIGRNIAELIRKMRFLESDLMKNGVNLN